MSRHPEDAINATRSAARTEAAVQAWASFLRWRDGLPLDAHDEALLEATGYRDITAPPRIRRAGFFR